LIGGTSYKQRIVKLAKVRFNYILLFLSLWLDATGEKDRVVN
jgi:hypothetical protein